MNWSARISMPSSKDTAPLPMCRPDGRGVAATLAQGLHGHRADILDADPQTVAFS